MHPPLVLDLDDSVGDLPDAHRLPLQDWQPRLRFGCKTRTLQAFARHLDGIMPPAYGTVLMGSGDYHHLSWPLIERTLAGRTGVRVVVFDNHPDNMRYLFGIHCGSWVRRIALHPAVSHVHVVGITSADIGNGHAWENYLRPLQTGKLTYWHMGVDTRWASWLGVAHAFKGFDTPEALIEALTVHLSAEQAPTYLSIDKDVFHPDVVRTNWDQGVMREAHVNRVIGLLQGQLIGSDITGDVSTYRHPSLWKRLLSAGDGQTLAMDEGTLRQWQKDQNALNERLVERLARTAVR